MHKCSNDKFQVHVSLICQPKHIPNKKTKQKLQTNPKKKQPIPVVVFRNIKMQNKIQKVVLARCCLDKSQAERSSVSERKVKRTA